MHPYRGGPRHLPVVSWPMLQGCPHCETAKIYLFEMCRQGECPDDGRMHEHFLCERCGYEWLCVFPPLPVFNVDLPHLPAFNFSLPALDLSFPLGGLSACGTVDRDDHEELRKQEPSPDAAKEEGLEEGHVSGWRICTNPGRRDSGGDLG